MEYLHLGDWLNYLEAHQPETDIELGLSRVGAVANVLALRKPADLCFLVAGTNGKGSSCVFIESLLMAAGFTVGTTLSPHLTHFNERIRVSGSPVEDGLICQAFNAIEVARRTLGSSASQGVSQARKPPHLTYFEMVILAALYVFKAQSVDACVLEIGLGGRLDAANIIHPDVSIITSIGLDHQEFLGHDRETIGREKAGIMRSDVPCVYGETDMPVSIGASAESLGAILYRMGEDFEYSVKTDSWSFKSNSGVSFDYLPLPLVAPINAATAIEAVSKKVLLNLDHVRGACSKAGLPGRFEQMHDGVLNLVIDVAHNPHAARFLLAQMGECPGRTVCIAGFLTGKDVAGIVKILNTVVDEWIFVDTGSDFVSGRAQTGIESAELANANSDNATHRSVHAMKSVKSALNYCRNVTVLPDRVVIMGSFDVVQQAHEITKPR
ncbi:MAG: hypothetical protein KUG75_06845 [Pseudomonadales bacterium]|nr:hypothetical protein [Pseudomonadales bacterium]